MFGILAIVSRLKSALSQTVALVEQINGKLARGLEDRSGNGDGDESPPLVIESSTGGGNGTGRKGRVNHAR